MDHYISEDSVTSDTGIVFMWRRIRCSHDVLLLCVKSVEFVRPRKAQALVGYGRGSSLVKLEIEWGKNDAFRLWRTRLTGYRLR